jgi:hypothetical protein
LGTNLFFLSKIVSRGRDWRPSPTQTHICHPATSKEHNAVLKIER